MSRQAEVAGAQVISEGQAVLGIELGSTNIKAVLIGPDTSVLATGSYAWENQLVDGLWTYSLDAVWVGIQGAFAQLMQQCQELHGQAPKALANIGISAMMHGYLPFDAQGNLLTNFRTWRNTNTDVAARQLSTAVDFAFPHRWSASHYYQAIIDAEAHVPHVRHLTTLAGYVHWKLTGHLVLGVGDASGMFPIDPATGSYDAARAAQFDALVAGRGPQGLGLLDLLPEVLTAGNPAGRLTQQGAALLDPTGSLAPGAVLCPPEGDAGTGMVATNAVTPRTGNVSAGTSIFAMVVLDKPLARVHPELDIVTTPSGDLVAMVHCNNGSSELGQWAGLLGEFTTAVTGKPADMNQVFSALLTSALEGQKDAGGLLAYNYLAGEPITGIASGAPMVMRTPSSQMSLANFARAQVYGVFGTLSVGMKTLEAEGVGLDAMFAHGGLFKTAQVAQRFLAAALNVPVSVGDIAAEGGAWGIAVLARYTGLRCQVSAGADAPVSGAGAADGAASHGANGAANLSLSEFLASQVFADAAISTVAPDPADVAGYSAYLANYQAGLAAMQAAAQVCKSSISR